MTVLNRILASTRVAVAAAKANTTERRLLGDLASAPPVRDFRAALARPGLHLIAEMKRRSPSAGELCDPYEPGRLAAVFAGNGAAAISVLTEGEYFGGALEDLQTVRGAAEIPLLRKDFIIDAYQLLEGRVHGADAALLICAILPDALLAELLTVARAVSLCPLVEVHDADEVRRALALGADVIGINNRDLQTLRTDLATTVRLRSLIPNGHVVISESGLGSKQELAPLQELGVNAILVGESILRSPDIAAKVRELSSLDAH